MKVYNPPYPSIRIGINNMIFQVTQSNREAWYFEEFNRLDVTATMNHLLMIPGKAEYYLSMLRYIMNVPRLPKVTITDPLYREWWPVQDFRFKLNLDIESITVWPSA